MSQLVSVLKRVYGFEADAIAAPMRSLIAADAVRADTDRCEPALTIFESGGNFADGAIAAEGATLGAETFVACDQRAVKLLDMAGIAARLLP